MIDEKINNSLKELEDGLKSIESSRKQVEATVKSYNDLSATTTEYVKKLETISNKIKELIENVGKDYNQKVKSFEKDRENVISASNNAIKKLSDATDEFNESVFEMKEKLKYSFIMNIISLVGIAIGVIALFLK